jgi:phosphohistidine phosphatase SixA
VNLHASNLPKCVAMLGAMGLAWALAACQPVAPSQPAPMGAMSAGSADPQASIQDMDPAEQQRLIGALRSGGYIIYFRHGATDPNQTDSDPSNLTNCATQRNLTDAGRAQARFIGEAFRSLGIPVGTVLSSQYCRAIEYSQIAFNAASPDRSLNLTDPLGDYDKADSVRSIKRLLATPPMPGMNTILVSHSPNIRLATDVDLPVEGEAAIFRVQGAGTNKLITRVLPTEWQVLAQSPSAI